MEVQFYAHVISQVPQPISLRRDSAMDLALNMVTNPLSVSQMLNGAKPYNRVTDAANSSGKGCQIVFSIRAEVVLC